MLTNKYHSLVAWLLGLAEYSILFRPPEESGNLARILGATFMSYVLIPCLL